MRFNPPKVAGKDDVTGELLSQRPDDDAVRLAIRPFSLRLRADESLSRQLVVRKRLEGFHQENDPLLAHYGQNVHTFEGRTSKEIWPGLVDALSSEVSFRIVTAPNDTQLTVGITVPSITHTNAQQARWDSLASSTCNSRLSHVASSTRRRRPSLDEQTLVFSLTGHAQGVWL